MNKYMTAIMCLVPILNVYNFPGLGNVGMGAFIAIVLMISIGFNYYVFSKEYRFAIKFDAFLGYFIYLLFITVINVFYFSDTTGTFVALVLRLFQNVIYILPIFFVDKRGIDQVLNVYLKISFGLSMIIILQTMLYNLLGIETYFLLSSLDMHYANSNVNEMIAARTEYRPSAVFPEPAYFSSYIIYAVTILMFGRNIIKEYISYKKHVMYMLAIVGAIFLSTSFGGIMMLMMLSIIYLLTTLLHVQISEKKLYFSLTIISIIVFANVFAFDMTQNIITRIGYFHIDDNISLKSSNDLRLLLGYLLYWDMDTTSKIFGVGCATLEEYFVSIQNIYVLTLGQAYMNGVAFVLCSSGIVGMILMIKWIHSCWVKGQVLTKCLLLTFMFIQFYSNNILSFNIFIFYSLLMVSLEKEALHER